MVVEMTSRTNSNIPLQSPKALSVKRNIKTRIYKTYHHDICMTYKGLVLTSDLTLEDSDPDETQHMLSTMVLNTDRDSSSPPDSRSDRAARTKYSIGGISTVDSGVVSHDSLLDRYRDMSVARSERSESPYSRYSTLTTTHRSSSQGRGEFDPLNRPVMLDSKLRSRSRSRLEEEQQRGKSPRRSHGVKQMINFFEGSQEDLNVSPYTTTVTSTLTNTATYTTAHSTPQSHTEPPPIKQALYTSPIRLVKKRNSQSKSGSPVTTGLSDTEEVIVTGTPTRIKQDNSLHLTCVASGYAKYSPYSERKSYQTENEASRSHASSTECINSVETSSNHKLNGAIKDAVTPTAVFENGESDTTHMNGDSKDAFIHTKSGSIHNINSDKRISTRQEDSGIVSSDSVNIALTDSGIITPDCDRDTSSLSNGHGMRLSLDLNTSRSSLDIVDRSVRPLTVNDSDLLGNQQPTENKQTQEQPPENKQTKQQPKDCEITKDQPITNGVDTNIQDSPSKKNGEWFLKVTDNAQIRLLALCEVAGRDLEIDTLTEEVSGQIRADIGKAQLLVNKKFKQFRGLCDKNLTQGPDEPFPTTSQDLAGFWDLVFIQIEQCEANFSDIDALRANGWVQPDKLDTVVVTPRKPITPRSQKSIDGAVKTETKAKNKSTNKPSGAAKARDEARKRLMAAKKAMRERRNSETDDVIYVTSS